MPDDSKAHSLGRADFLTDLRGQLEEAARRAKGGSLKLGVTSVEVTLEVACTLKAQRRGLGWSHEFRVVRGGADSAPEGLVHS